MLSGCRVRRIHAARAGSKRSASWRQGVGLRARVVAGAPRLLPIVLTPLPLARRQLGLVRVDMDLVRVDAHAELCAAAGLRKEPRLQPHRKEHERPIAGAQRRQHRRGKLRRGGGRQDEIAAKESPWPSRSASCDELRGMDGDAHGLLAA